MPPHVLSILANGLLMGNVLAACPVTMSVKISGRDDFVSNVTVMEDINKAIKSNARTITRTKLSEKIPSEIVLQKAKLKCLNESVASIMATTVWKSKQSMNLLGQCLFKDRSIQKTSTVCLRSDKSNELRPPVPGYPNLATNIMAKVWNSVPELHEARTLGAARATARKWARGIPR